MARALRIEHHEAHSRPRDCRLHRSDIYHPRRNRTKSLTELITNRGIERYEVARPAPGDAVDHDSIAKSVSIEPRELWLDFDLALVECLHVQHVAEQDLPWDRRTAIL